MAADPLSTTFAALADPTRRAILARLASGETSVGELAEPFDMSLPAVSKHLKVLEGAGLISRGRDAQWRPCRLEAAPLREVSEWVGSYQQFCEQNFDRLDAFDHHSHKFAIGQFAHWATIHLSSAQLRVRDGAAQEDRVGGGLHAGLDIVDLAGLPEQRPIRQTQPDHHGVHAARPSRPAS